MITLAIDTALATCSAALFDGDRLLAAADERIGRGHAERLVPLIAELMSEAGVTRADEILVDIGPGSFTGIRVGLAAAKAFGIAWGAPVRGFTSTALVAAASGEAELFVALEAGRGELYVQRFAPGVRGEIAAMPPAAALELTGDVALAGSGAALMGARAVGPEWPRARDVLLLNPADRDLPPRPLYVRPPDAKLPS